MQYKDGVTLIELLIVLSLVMLVTSLAFVQLSFLDATVVHADIDMLQMMCRFLQYDAMATNSIKTMTFDEISNSYYVDKQRETLSKQVAFGYLKNAKGPPGSPHAPIDNPITFPSHTIYFYPSGIISSGTIYLIDKARQHMYALSNAVSSVSYLRLYTYMLGTWKLCENAQKQ